MKNFPKELQIKYTTYRQYQYNAKKRNLIFNISIDMFIVLSSSNCFYCGIEPRFIDKTKRHEGKGYMNGIDRLDNSLGYTESNCVPCCFICNSAKSDMSKETFIDMCNKVSEKYKKENIKCEE